MSRAAFGRTSCVSWRSPADMHKSHHDRCKVVTNLAMSHSVLSSILRTLRQKKVLLTGVDFSAQGVKVGWDITSTIGITKYSKVRNIRCNNQTFFSDHATCLLTCQVPPTSFVDSKICAVMPSCFLSCTAAWIPVKLMIG